MAAKAFFVICASALMAQTISGQCIGVGNNIAGTTLADELALAGNRLPCGSNPAGLSGYPGSYGLAANSFVPSSGGGFAVTSYSPIAPTGITVVSENAIEGALTVNGELPFLGAVAVDGALPTAGAGGINYGCGSGSVAIVSEVAPAGPYAPVAPAAGLAPGRIGYGPGLAGPGLAGSGLGAPGLGPAGPGLGYNGLAGPGCGFNGVY
ncbi:chorion class B protein M2807-like [Helicoverpa zea]|uniref:chorion class B protein M2807-like n=1 Tax=Helicoverpa zea TaxID=7113 RepID=UPI001F582D20|nr:chorion class B protein M2807-like [Helicoverpa zea]